MAAWRVGYNASAVMGIFGIVLSLALLMYLAYRGVTVLVLAPVLALLAALLGGDTRLLATYTQIFMTGLGGFLVRYFPLFLLGAIFGRLMADSGSAAAIAEWIVAKLGHGQAVMAIVLACAVLTYGGVSVFVVAFAVYPVAVALCRRSSTPKRLIPGAILLGSATFTMSAIPGSPAIQNAIPMPFFGTDAFAAPVLGTLAGLVMFAIGAAWFSYRVRAAKDEGYGRHPLDAADEIAATNRPSFVVAVLPIVIVIVVNYLITRLVIPVLDLSYLAERKYGSVSVEDVRGIWSLIAAMTVAIVGTIALNWHRWVDLNSSVNQGTLSSLLPIFNTASEVGYGSVIASLAAFAAIQSAVVGLFPENPLISEAIAVNVMAGVTGSASGGLSIALNMLGAKYLELGNAAGISPQLLHRVSAIASGGFDSLPHNGVVITLIGICRLTHRESYLDIFAVTVVGPLVALAVALVLGTLFGAF